MRTTIGSLFAGYGGLDLALGLLGPARTAWVADIEPGPRRVLAHRYPDAPDIGDVTSIDWGRVEPVDIICGGSPCFVAGTPVLTHDGLRPIEEVRAGDLVWTHAARWQRVAHTMRRTSETIEFRSGFYCTPEHRLWLRTPQQRWNNAIRRYRRRLETPEWVEAKDSHNLFAASPVSVTHEGVSKPDTLTWWQIGRFVADGYVNNQVNVYIGKGKESDADNFPGWTHYQQETALCLTMPKSAAERDWLTEHFGKLAHRKTIPAFLLAETEENRRAFLDGYWSGDGWNPEGRKFTQSNSVSACLTTGIELLAKSLGYTCTVSQCQVTPTKVIEGRTVNQRPWWMVRATPDDGRFTETDADWHWFKLRRAPKAGEVTTVYDLTVERDHSFIAAGIVVHNCQDLSVAGRRAGMRPGTRSGLWESMAAAIHRLAPPVVIWENVPGARSAPAWSRSDDDDFVGTRGWTVDQDQPLCRALGRVAGDLASLGYDAQWTTVRASDVGAPHRRARIFLLATRRETAADALRIISDWPRHPRDGRPESPDRDPRDAMRLLPTPSVVDQGSSKTIEEWDAWTARMRREHGNGDGNGPSLSIEVLRTAERGGIDYGPYLPAIIQWETLTRPSPPPTEPAPSGRRLSARFVEWMMGLPEGWVTGVPGVSRTAQLRMLGNGVVPQQAAHALSILADWATMDGEPPSDTDELGTPDMLASLTAGRPL